MTANFLAVKVRIITLVLVMLGGIGTVVADAPTIDPADDARYFGPIEDLYAWTPEQIVAGFRNMDKILPTRGIRTGETVLPLSLDLANLDDTVIRSRATTLTLDEYFKRQSVAGLLVIKDGEIAYERYGLGNSQDTRWVSFSVAKSVTSMLVGAAVQDGYIESVDKKVTDYLPRLRGSSYEDSSIRDLLQMSSGVQWNETYADPSSDIASVNWETMALYEYLRDLPRNSTPGEAFNYNTAETNLVGNLLGSAIGNNLATYLEEKIWKPFGMGEAANWVLTEPGGGEFGGSRISATLRDFGRIGLFALGNGQLADGTQVLPASWMDESTSPSRGNAGYGYLWWLNPNGSYHANGIFGQGIYINPQENIVIALHSARPDASNGADSALQDALYAALVDMLKGV
tara:strand:+ start:786 stop:1988 length:1203 start_codon:yes stop_codon:yes gene_type:complete